MDNFIKYEIVQGGGSTPIIQSAGCGGGGVSSNYSTTGIQPSGTPYKYVITYYFTAASGGTKYYNWKFQGSNNNSSWTDIQTGQVSCPASNNRSGSIENDVTANYTYYRLYYSLGGPGSVQSAGGFVIVSI